MKVRNLQSLPALRYLVFVMYVMSGPSLLIESTEALSLYFYATFTLIT